MLKLNKKNKYFLYALIILCISAYLLYFSVTKLNSKADNFKILSINKNSDEVSESYCINYNSIPIIEFEKILILDEFDSLVVKGKRATKGEAKEFNFQLSFNALGQLYSSSLALPIDEEYTLNFFLEGVLESKINLNLKKNNETYSNYDLSIPGPLLIREKLKENEGISIFIPSELAPSKALFEQFISSSEQFSSLDFSNSGFKIEKIIGLSECTIEALPTDLATKEKEVLEQLLNIIQNTK